MAPEEALAHAADLERGGAVIALYVHDGRLEVKFNPPMEGVTSWFN
jgi:hypothetical protein